MNVVNFILLVILHAGIGVSAGVLFKYGTRFSNGISFTMGNINFHISIVSMLGIILYLVSFCIALFLISKNDLSKMTPVNTGITFIFTFLAGSIVFNEQITIAKIIGICFIIFGVSIITVKG